MMGASSGPGSREPSPEGLGPPGFDPSRTWRLFRFWCGRHLMHAGLRAFPKGRVRNELGEVLNAWGRDVRLALVAAKWARDSDGSGEAGETPQSGSTEGDSAGRNAASPNSTPSTPSGHQS